MQKVIQTLKQQEKSLLRIKKEIARQLSEVPDGRMKIRMRNGRPEYHLITPEGKEQYLRKDQSELICALAQKTYLIKFDKDISKQLDAIQQFLKNYSNEALTASYQSLSNERQKLINPIYLPDEQYIEEWQNKPYKMKGFSEYDPEIYTERGERVRSKTEKMIADKLFMLEIPYKYECPVELHPMGMVYTDFTLLDVKRRKEIRLEHFGMMDDPQYAASAVRKIEAYIKNGFIPGKNLILTYESSKNLLDMRVLEACLNEILE